MINDPANALGPFEKWISLSGWRLEIIYEQKLNIFLLLFSIKNGKVARDAEHSWNNFVFRWIIWEFWGV